MSDQQNTVMAIVLSIIVIVAFEFFYMGPQREELARYNAQQEATQQEAAQADTAQADAPQAAVRDPSLPSVGDAPNLPGAGSSLSNGVDGATDGATPAPADGGAANGADRDQALAATARIEIRSPRLMGSISLQGGRIDDVVLVDYRETVEPDSPRIVLMSPQGSKDAYFAEFGWIGPDGPLPGRDAVWRADGNILTAEQPVTLKWDNGEGIAIERRIAIDDNYLFTVTQRVINSTSRPIEMLPYSLINRSNTPKTLGFYILHEGLLGVFDGTLAEVEYSDLQEDPQGTETYETTGGWIGITDKYWLAALLPDQAAPITARFTYTNTSGVDKYQVDTLRSSQVVPAGGAVEITDRVFIGAKEVAILDDYSEKYGVVNFDLAVDFGWFYFITKPIFYALNFFYDLIGNFGLAILMLTVLIKGAFFPLANKSYKAMSKMKLLQPKITELREKFGDDKAGMQKEMMALYKSEKVNPAAGCLPVVVQIPVFFSLYKVLFVTIEMRQAPFFGWIRDLSVQDPSNLFDLFGLIAWTPPSFLNVGVWALLMGFTMWLQQRLNPQPADPTQAKIMMMLPIMFTFILARFPAGLVIYWCWNNILSITQQWLIMKKMGAKV